MTWKSINHSLFLSHIPALSPYEDYGFRVAVLASIVSSAIILFMSVAFITCCLLDCIKEDKRKKQERWVREWERLSVSALWCICKLKNEILFFTGSQICGSGRSRPSIRRTTGLATAIKAGTTTTTTPRRRCFHCGTPTAQPCVTTCEPTGETWTNQNVLKDKRPAQILKKCLPVFSSADVISITPMVQPAPMIPLPHTLLYLASTTTSLSYPET